MEQMGSAIRQLPDCEGSSEGAWAATEFQTLILLRARLRRDKKAEIRNRPDIIAAEID